MNNSTFRASCSSIKKRTHLTARGSVTYALLKLTTNYEYDTPLDAFSQSSRHILYKFNLEGVYSYDVRIQRPSMVYIQLEHSALDHGTLEGKNLAIKHDDNHVPEIIEPQSFRLTLMTSHSTR